MPFDGTENTPALNRTRLIAALRAPMPSGFRWWFPYFLVYDSCGTAGCAMGLAVTLGLMSDTDGDELLAKKLGLSESDVGHVFYNESEEDDARFYGVAMDQVTPQMVADALERIT